MLNRLAETHLKTWLNKYNRKPLVLRGARQVSKSTLVATKKNTPLAVRFDLNPPGIQDVSHQISTGNEVEFANYKLLSLPLYLVEALPDVLNEIRTQIKII